MRAANRRDTSSELLSPLMIGIGTQWLLRPRLQPHSAAGHGECFSLVLCHSSSGIENSNMLVSRLTFNIQPENAVGLKHRNLGRR